MSFAEWLFDTWTYASQTLFYLLAYKLMPVWALLASLSLKMLRFDLLGESWLRKSGGLSRFSGSLALAFSLPASGGRMERHLRLLKGRPLETAAYLTAGHGWIVYHLFLMGPLLGKDVLFSQLTAGVLFLLLTAAGLSRWCEVDPSAALQEPKVQKSGRAAMIWEEVWRVSLWIAYGLLLGGAVAAWGTSDWAAPQVDFFDSQLLDQMSGAILGVFLSVTLGLSSVSNLFVGTYLWKTGLAHAGMLAFFLAAPLAPQRWGLYRRVWGGATSRLLLVLASAAVSAGLLTAALHGVFDLTINYKLKPDQLWDLRLAGPETGR